MPGLVFAGLTEVYCWKATSGRNEVFLGISRIYVTHLRALHSRHRSWSARHHATKLSAGSAPGKLPRSLSERSTPPGGPNVEKPTNWLGEGDHAVRCPAVRELRVVQFERCATPTTKRPTTGSRGYSFSGPLKSCSCARSQGHGVHHRRIHACKLNSS